MINNNLKNNWKQILNYNSKVKLVEKAEHLKEKVKIPLTPIEVEAYLLHYLFALLYPRFINDQKNIVDLILSDYDIENKVLALYLYKTPKPGIHESMESLPQDLVIIKESHLKDLNQLFRMVQSRIEDKKKVKISSIRIFKKRAIDLINTHVTNLKKFSFNEFLYNLLDLIQKIIEERLIFLFPKPNIYSFLEDLLKLLNGLKLSECFKLIDKFIPDFKTLISFHSKKQTILLEVNKELSKARKPQFFLSLKTPQQINLELSHPLSKQQLQLIQKEFNSDIVLSLKQGLFLSFFTDLCDLQFPIKKPHFKLLLQKFLFGIRSFEIHWTLIPRPKIYNTILKFIVRLIGINTNLKKLSHWAIPDLLFNIIDTYFGLNSNILIVLTHKNKFFTKRSLLLEIEDSSVKNIFPIDNRDLYEKGKVISLKKVKDNLFKERAIFPVIIKVDKRLIELVISILIFQFHKIKPLSFLKIIRLIKKDEFFQIYPESAPYRLLKEKGSFSFLKLLLSIAIDKHEF